MPLFAVVEAQPPVVREVFRRKWMTIPPGEVQFFPDFKPGASCL